MAQKDPKHNLDALLVGTAEFSFSDGALTPAETMLKGWLDLGNVVSVTPSLENQSEEHFGSYRGVRRKDKTINTQSRWRYQLKLDEWNYEVVRLLCGGSSGTGFTQLIQAAAATDAWAFSAGTPSGTQKWFDVKVGGLRIRNLTAFTIAAKVEGVDFEVDLLVGRVRFLVSQVASTVGAVTAPAIAAGSAQAFLGIAPLSDIVRAGYGRLTIYDQNDTNKVVLDHVDFSCDISAESAGELNGTAVTEITLNVDVSADLATILLRQANNN